MAKLIFEATGLAVEVPNEKVETMLKRGFTQKSTTQTPKKIGEKNASKSK